MNLNAMTDPTLSLADTCSQGSPGLGPSVLSGAGESGDTQQAEVSSSCLPWTWPAPGRGENRLGAWPHERGGRGSWRYSEAWSVRRPLTDRSHPHGSRAESEHPCSDLTICFLSN